MKKEIVYTDKYALILSDEEIKEGDYYLLIPENKVKRANNVLSLNRDWKKVIGYLNLNDAPILEGVPLLPPLPQGDDVDALAKSQFRKSEYEIELRENAFVLGYNKAKEKYKYTEEDVRRAFHIGRLYMGREGDTTIVQFMESIQQPSRPTHFECEMEITHEGNGTYSTDLMDIGVSNLVPINIPKTITNSQGYIELVGKYLNL